MRVYRSMILLSLVLLLSDSFASDSLKINARLQYYKSKIAEHDMAFSLKSVFYDSIISIHTARKDQREVVQYMMNKAKMLTENGEYTRAYSMYKSTISGIDSLSVDNNRYYREQRKECMLQLSNIAINIAMYDEAMSYLYELIKYNDDENMNYSVKANSLLGIVFGSVNNRVSAKEYHRKAMSMVKTIDTLWDGSIFAVYNNYAVMFYIDKNFDSTLYYLLKSEKYCQKAEYKRLLISHYTNMALTYQDLEDYALAENYYKDAIKVSIGGDTYFSKAMTFLNISRLYVLQKRYDQAYNSLIQGIEIATKIGAKTLIANMFSVMSELKFVQQDYKTAYEYLAKSKEMNDSIFNSNSMDRMMIMQNNFDTDRMRMEKESLEQALIITELNNENKSIMLIILLVVILLITIAGAMLFIKLFKQYRVNTALNEAIHGMHNEEQSKIESSKVIFENTIDTKNRELTSSALSLMHMNEMLSDVKENFRKLIDSDNEDERTNIAKQINSLINSSNTDGSWQEFKLYFEQVHQSFFKKLEKKHPDLSTAELKLCALIVLNMNAKEIATITNRTPRSVETFIYRLRKKVGLSSDVKVITYLKTFID